MKNIYGEKLNDEGGRASFTSLLALPLRGGGGMRRPLKIQIGEDVNWVHTEALVKPISVFARKRPVIGYGIVVQVKSCPPRIREVKDDK